jgi:hypothetical protein
MKDINRIVDVVIKAINESEKSFDELQKNVVLNYLSQLGIKDNSNREKIYSLLGEHYSSKKKVEVSKKEAPKAVYTEKNPRKSIFGEIKRIA